MIYSRIHHLITLLLAMTLLTGVCAAKQLAVVVDKDNATATVTSADLVKLFKSDLHAWPDGRSITIVVRDPADPEMQLALDKLYKASASDLRTLINAHKSSMIVAESDEAVLRIVSSTRGAVGLVDVYSINKNIKVVKVDGKLPLEPGYALRGN